MQPKLVVMDIVRASLATNRDWTLLLRMVLLIIYIFLICILFLLVFSFIIRSIIVILVVKSFNGMPGVSFEITPKGTPGWLTIGLPIAITITVFSGLIAIDRWQQGLLNQRFEAATEEPPVELIHRLTKLSQVADVPPPAIRVVHHDVPTAFTTGIRIDQAQITVTSGLLHQLRNDELEAVLAHEVSHVKNRDVAVMTAAMVPVVMAAGIWEVVTTDSDQSLDQTPTSRKGADPHRFEGIIGGIVGIVAGTIWLFARFATAKFARYREFAADSGASAITGNPAMMAVALETISRTDTPTADLRMIGIDAFSIRPLSQSENQWTAGWQTPLDILPDRIRTVISKYMSFHPSTAERLRRLRALEDPE